MSTINKNNLAFFGIDLIFLLYFIIVPIILNILTRGTIWIIINLLGYNLKDYYWYICSTWVIITAIFIICKGDKQ